MAFPVDKQRIEGGGRDYSFEKFITAITDLRRERDISWRLRRYESSAVRSLLPDKQWLIDMMRLAPAKTGVIIHNPARSSIV